jgi:hypothetical protein
MEAKQMHNYENYVCKQTLTFIQKNADYGNSVQKGLDKHGKVYFLIQAENKVNRLTKLLKKGNMVKTESIEDTIDDLVNYTVMYYIWEAKEAICLQLFVENLIDLVKSPIYMIDKLSREKVIEGQYEEVAKYIVDYIERKVGEGDGSGTARDV